MRISLNQVSFLGFHGMYAEEKKIGNNFIVDLYVDFTPTQNSITHLEETIDYVTVFELVQKRMAIPTSLIETIVVDLADQILNDYALVQEVYIKITKEKMPIKNFEGNISVALTKKRSV
jgi:dihydroneopterin aldolase